MLGFRQVDGKYDNGYGEQGGASHGSPPFLFPAAQNRSL